MTQPLQQPIEFGKYTLYERIGRGGMADVFKGRIQGPAGFQRVFVVKRILPHLSDDPAFIRMFVEEAKLSARLNHPNIVQVFELGAVDGEFFISMESVSGHDLSETMRAFWRSSGAPPPELVAYIGREMCRGLAYAHGLTDESGRLLGMIHRDISPSNVMLSYEGAVKLLDFGIAKALGDTPEITRSGTLKGKYAYMAPEQTEGDDVDHRIDIFAAGVVMYEVLTGRRLFKGQNDIQTIERVRRCEVRPPSFLNPECPPVLDEILLRALARNPDDRFQTAGEMADALDEVVHAAHFTPQHMASAVRQAFGLESGTGVGGASADRRLPSSITTSSLSVTAPSSLRRSPTVPPVSASGARNTGRLAAFGAGATDAAILSAIAPRPLWKRASFWIVTLLCAGGIGVAGYKGVGLTGLMGDPAGVTSIRPGAASAAAPPVAASVRKIKNMPVLIQSEPEGADIYVSGKLESLGTTPRWVSVEVDPGAPVRVMVRKAGFQDKAFAVEAEKPPVVHLIPIGAAPTPAPPMAATGRTSPSAAAGSDVVRSAASRAARPRMTPREKSPKPKDTRTTDDGVGAAAVDPPPESSGETPSE